jgi:hypothetical protein
MGQTSNKAVSTIAADINTGRFLSHMRNLFSTSTIFLAELMQNARRAGASSVRFSLDADAKSIIVIDDGCGIDDFVKLIQVAESGWDEAINDAEDPFGIGFCSVIFAASSVLVESKGKKVTLTADEVVAKQAIQVFTSEFIGGTRVTLFGVTPDIAEIAKAVNTFARGFPIPVFLDAEELPRPHAIANLANVHETIVGSMYVPGLDMSGRAVPDYDGWVYCQGLPIKAGRFTHSWLPPEADHGVVHIDHKTWKPRVPDRDVLIDQDKANEAVTNAINELWRDEMMRRKPLMSPLEFADRYWKMAWKLGCQSVMNDVPVIPAVVLWRVDDYPINDTYNSVTTSYLKPVARQQVECGEVTLCTSIDNYLEGDNFLRLMLVRQLDWVICEKLPEGHWACRYVVDLEALPIRISGKQLTTEEFSGAWTSGTVKLIDKLAAIYQKEGKREIVLLSEPVALGSDAWATTYLVPRNYSDSSIVLRQASSYTDDSDHFEETDLALDQEGFDELVAMMNGESTADTLKKCIKHTYSKKGLHGKSFQVAFDAEGEITVQEIAGALPV